MSTFLSGRGGRIARIAVPAAIAAVTLSSVAVASAPAPSVAGPGGSGNTVSNGTDPDATSLSLGAQWWPFSTGPGQLGAIPQALAFDQVIDGRRTKKMLMTVTRNEDSGGATLHNTMKVAQDNGLEFTDFDKLPDGFNWASSGRLTDGTIKLVKFVPGAAPAPNRFSLTIGGSADLGATWKVANAPIVEDKWKFDWYRATHGLMELADGTLLQPVYAGGTYNGKAGSFVVILQSTDHGASWTERSLLNTDGDSSEVAWSRTTDGRIIAITRSNEGSGNPTKPMKQTYSDDDGLTWQPQTAFAPPPGMPSEGILPELALQTNGALLLTYGRPDNNVAVSWDGTGKTWDDGKVVYANYIRTTERGRSMGSSGNTSIVADESNSSLNFGDICHNIWSCREHGQQVGVWAQRIDAVTAGTGKLDLATGIRDGIMKITGDVVPADPAFAEQRLQGAVDGSNEYRAAARLADSAPKRITVELDQVYTLNKIGLMLDRGVENGAKVQLSVDGKTWSAPVVRQRNSVDYAVRYHDIAPTQARFVRVTGDGNAPFTALNELELYSADTWTFENDAINATPRGTTDTLHAFTADTIMPGQNSQRRAIIVDMDPDTRGTMTFPVADAPGLHLQYGFAGEGYGSGAIWELLGKDAAGNTVAAWKFLFKAAAGSTGFSLSAWDGTAWKDVGVFPTFTPNYQWIGVQINANASTAQLKVHGKTLTTSVRAAEAKTLNGFRPSTGLNVADQNMEHSYDNLQIRPLAPYEILGSTPDPVTTYPRVPASFIVHAHNYSDQDITVPVSAIAPKGYRVDGAGPVRLPAGKDADVLLTVTRTTAGEEPARLAVTVGDRSTTVSLIATDDFVRGAAMAQSSTGSSASSAENLNDGKIDTTVWGSGGAGAWNDGTAKVFPDWVTATWTQPVKLGKVVVYTLDSPAYPASAYGVRDYDVQVRTSTGDWKTVATVTGNTEGIVTSTFTPVSTTALRILINDSNDHSYSRLISVQGFSK